MKQINALMELMFLMSDAVLSGQKVKGEQLKYGIQQLVQPSDSEVAQLKSQIKVCVFFRAFIERICQNDSKALNSIQRVTWRTPFEQFTNFYPHFIEYKS